MGGLCIDTDECQQQANICPSDSACQNTLGSYQCVRKCPNGMKLAEDGENCEDIDECSQSSSLCPSGKMCTNFMGGYRCDCPSGFRLNEEDACEDVDECLSAFTVCGVESECQNFPGSYRCTCKSGFRRNSDDRCVDINECKCNFIFFVKNRAQKFYHLQASPFPAFASNAAQIYGAHTVAIVVPATDFLPTVGVALTSTSARSTKIFASEIVETSPDPTSALALKATFYLPTKDLARTSMNARPQEGHPVEWKARHVSTREEALNALTHLALLAMRKRAPTGDAS